MGGGFWRTGAVLERGFVPPVSSHIPFPNADLSLSIGRSMTGIIPR
jgi:hypothetical protein